MSDAAALLRQHADRCRRLADGTEDPRTSRILRDIAVDYERRAQDLDGSKGAHRPEPASIES